MKKMQAENKILAFWSKKAILIYLWFLIIAFIFYPQSTNATVLGEKRAQIKQLEQEINQKRNQIAKKEAEANTLANQVDIMNNEIQETELQIKATQLKIEDTKKLIDKTNKLIEQKERELDDLKKTMEESLRVIYEEGDRSQVEIFLSSGTLSEALDRTEYLDAVENKIENTMDEISKLKIELENKKADLEQQKKDLGVLLSEQKAAKGVLVEQKVVKDQLLAITRGQEAAYQAQLAGIKSIYEQSNSELKKLEEAARRARGGGPSVPSASGFFWPMRGRITAYFCDPNYFAGICHSGIDIATSAGTPIVASKSGIVIAVVDGYGNTFPNQYIYGNYVKIDHGEGFVSVYGHLQAGVIPVRVDDRVEAGKTIIGYEGNSGFSTGPHLHFEIRYNGIPIDPLRFLP